MISAPFKLTKFMRRWLAALRSGNYKQTTQVLRNLDNEVCCLGVMADVAGRRWIQKVDGYSPAGSRGHSAACMPSRRLCKEVGLPYHVAERLAQDNDNGCSFQIIAGKIEAYARGEAFDL